MNGVLGILQSISNIDKNHLCFYINALEEHQSFRLNNTSANDASVQQISALLSKPENRLTGLLLLQSFLRQCSLDVLEQKGILWTSQCVKTCQKETDISALAYENLSILIKKSSDLPELSKSFSSTQIVKICETLTTNTNPSTYLSTLKCLEMSLKIFPGACGGISRSYIDKFLSNFIDSNSENLVTWSAKCMHLLQQVGGGGLQGSSHKTACQKYQLQIIGSLHETLNIMYKNCHEIYDDGVEIIEKMNIKPLNLSDEPVKRAVQLSIRFQNLSTYLIVAIREPFPVSKLIMPQKILNLISRGLGVTCDMLQTNLISDNIAIGALLPDIHAQLFKVIDVLLLILKSNFRLYSDMLFRFVTETLKWTSSGKSDGFRKPYGKLRVAAYDTLSLWCKTLKHGSCVESIFDSLIVQIIDDITPFQCEMTLKVLSGARKHMSKKARRELHKAQNVKSHLVQTHAKSFNPHNMKVVYSDHENHYLCRGALQCLEMILLSATCFLKPIQVKEVQEKILINCLQCNELYNLNDKVSLYSNYLCRKELYNVLMAIITSRHYLCPPPIEMSVYIFSQAQLRDPSNEVRDACAKHMTTIEKMLNPQKGCLYFPSDINEIKNALKGVKKNTEAMEEESSSDSSEEEDNVPEVVIKTNVSNANLETVNLQKDQLNMDIISVNSDDEEMLQQNEEVKSIEKLNITKSPKRKLSVISTNEYIIELLVEDDSEENITKKFCKNTETRENIVIGLINVDNEESIILEDNPPVILENSKNVDIPVLLENNEELNGDDLVDKIAATFVNELN